MDRRQVALDARLTPQMSVGMQAYARELAARLPRIAPDLAFVIFKKGGNFGWNEQVRLPLQIRRAHADLTHFLSLYTPAVTPKPYIVTVHDLIHLRFPQYFKTKVKPYYRTVVKYACRRAARIITDNERTAADLQRFLKIDPARIRVVPLGADDCFFSPAPPYRAERPYLLYVGNHREHKDLPTLFAAWAGLDADVELDLYVTGPDDFASTRAPFARENGRIVALGDVTQKQLASYYAGARALVHPALCEGFGLPMLEALASGCPVIACEDALPGVLAGTALTFPPRSVEGARSAIERMLSDEGPAKALVNEGRVRASALTWNRCAERTAAIYREVLEERTR